MMSVAIAVAGLALLLFGAEVMIRGAVGIAKQLRVSPHVIGLTVIAFGTSAPELFVSLKAAMQGSPGIAIGNVVGSNIANILLMIGTVGLICPFLCNGGSLRRDGAVLLGSTLVFVALAMNGMIERWHGVLMFAALLGYLVLCYVQDRAQGDDVGIHAKEVEDIDSVPDSTLRASLYTLFGLVGVLFGARLLVDSAVEIAEAAGISETVIGMTLVAVGTSMPELGTTVVAVIRKHGDVALGNIIGSNIFNTLGILGVVSIVHPLPIPPELLSADLWLMLGVTVLFVAGAVSLRAFHRPIALVFFLIYAVFLFDQFYPVNQIQLTAF